MILWWGGFTNSLIKTDSLTICLVYSIGESKQDPANKTKRLRLVNSQLSPGLEIGYLNVAKGLRSEPNAPDLHLRRLSLRKPMKNQQERCMQSAPFPGIIISISFNPWIRLPFAFLLNSPGRFSCSSGKIVPAGNQDGKEPFRKGYSCSVFHTVSFPGGTRL